MITEREGKEKKPDVTAAAVSDGLLGYLEDARFGTAKHEALADYIYEIELEHANNSDIEDFNRVDNDPRKIRLAELRVLASIIALDNFKREMHDKKTRVSGYQDAYLKIWGGFHELGGLVNEEASAMFPNDEEQAGRVSRNKWENTFLAAQELIIDPKT